jgi:hypothetical protein
MLHQDWKLSRLLVEKYSNVNCCLERRWDHCFTRQEAIGQGSNKKRELDTLAVIVSVSKCIFQKGQYILPAVLIKVSCAERLNVVFLTCFFCMLIVWFTAI